MRYAYVGSRTTKERNARGEGLKVYEINDVGDWNEIQCIKVDENPSYQVLDNGKEYIYSAHGDITKVSSYSIGDDGKLTYLNSIDLGAKNPVYIVVDKTNKYIIVSTLQGGKVHVIERNIDGSLGAIVTEEKLEGKEEDGNSFAHQCFWDNKREYLFVPAQGRIIGYGQLCVFRFDTYTGKLEKTDTFLSREFAEPRHVAVHPNDKFIYLINERDSSMTFFEFDRENGKLHPRQILATLPETYTGNGQASAVLVDKTGQILIGSNRIHESLVLYRINDKTGYLTTLGFYPTLGLTPRFVGFDTKGEFLYAANEDSDNIVEMKLDSEKGTIEYTGRMINTESPVCITFK